MSGLLKNIGGGVLRVAAIVAPIPAHAIRLTAPSTQPANGVTENRCWWGFLGRCALVGGALNMRGGAFEGGAPVPESCEGLGGGEAVALGTATPRVLTLSVMCKRVGVLLRLQNRARGQHFFTAARGRGQVRVKVSMNRIRLVTASMAVAPPFRKLWEATRCAGYSRATAASLSSSEIPSLEIPIPATNTLAGLDLRPNAD